MTGITRRTPEKGIGTLTGADVAGPLLTAFVVLAGLMFALVTACRGGQIDLPVAGAGSVVPQPCSNH